jgi:hypothetical protein
MRVTRPRSEDFVDLLQVLLLARGQVHLFDQSGHVLVVCVLLVVPTVVPMVKTPGHGVQVWKEAVGPSVVAATGDSVQAHQTHQGHQGESGADGHDPKRILGHCSDPL